MCDQLSHRSGCLDFSSSPSHLHLPSSPRAPVCVLLGLCLLSFWFFFLTWTIFKVFIEFVPTLLLFHDLVFLAEGRVGPWLPDQGSEPIPHALQGGSLTPGPPGEARHLSCLFKCFSRRETCVECFLSSCLCENSLLFSFLEKDIMGFSGGTSGKELACQCRRKM